MRILFLTEVTDPGVGSSTRQMYQVARRLRELGHETACIGATQDAPAAGEVEIEGMTVTLLYSDYPLRLRGLVALKNPRVVRGVGRALAKFRPDVVHAHLIHTHLGYHSLTQARLAGAGVVFTAHDVMVFCYQKLTCFHGGAQAGGMLREYQARTSKCLPCQRLRFVPGRNRRIRRVLARDVHRFTTVSDALAEAITANGIQVDRTLHNAIELREQLPSPESVAEFEKRFDLVGKQVIAIGGRLHEQKGVSQLIAMLARLAPDFPLLRLIVMGKREIYDAEFRAQAETLGVGDRVVPTDYLSGEDLACAYAATDVFAMPSICFDTFGLVNLEAMEHAKPVVATEFGGSKEVIVHGETGFIENPYDLAAFSGRIAELLRDPERARLMGARGRARLEAQFRIERLTQECLEEYQLAQQKARSLGS